MPKLKDGVGARRPYLGDDHEEYWMMCPGCKYDHAIIVKWGSKTNRKEPQWSFNGDHEKPTFSPSLLYRGKRMPTDEEANKIMAGETVNLPDEVCHSFIKNGQWEFLSDCTHALAGKTVDMLEVP